MRTATRLDWHGRVEKAIGEIMRSLDKPIDLETLSREVCSSPYHFHRTFHQLVGETVHGCLRRLRLERAIFLLRNTDRSVTDVALDSGYETAESFAKAFRGAFGLSPREARRFREWQGFLHSQVGLHYAERGRPHWFYLSSQGDGSVDTKIVALQRRRIVGVENVGDYWGLPKAWDKLDQVIRANRLSGSSRGFMCVFPDHDERVSMADKRSFAAMAVDDGFANTFGLSEFIIPEGLYAVTVHFGSSEEIGPTWDRWQKQWLPESGWEADVTRPNYEWYQNQSVPPELQLTFLCTAVRRKG